MADMERLYTALRNADAAGDVEGARKLAAYIRQQQTQPAPQSQPAPVPEPVEQVEKPLMPQPYQMRQQPTQQFGYGTQVPKQGQVPDMGAAEAALTVASSALAEPIAGLAGIAGAVLPGDEGQGARAVEATREALTYQPRTEEGQASLQKLGEAVAPIGEAIAKVENALGTGALQATGSPEVATVAHLIPTIAAEILTLGLGGKVAKGTLNATDIGKATIRKADAPKRDVVRFMEEASPSINDLKTSSRAIYQEIDAMGGRLEPTDIEPFAESVGQIVKNLGGDPDITPKGVKALRRIQMVADGEDAITLQELDNLRKVAGNAAADVTNRADANIGSAIVDAIDEFTDNLTPAQLKGAAADATEVGKKYKVARELWGRARRSEMLQEAMTKAENQASGFENGIRVQFRQILNNPKKRRFFKKEELQQIRKVVEGDKKTNLFKFLGRFGGFEGPSTNMLGTLGGGAAGAAAVGPVGAVVVPAIGMMSKTLAQRLTRKGAKFADSIVRAGPDAQRITKAYLRNTPKELRSAEELTELLARPDVSLADVEKLEAGQFAQDALAAAKQRQRQAQLGAAVAAGTPAPTAQEQLQEATLNQPAPAPRGPPPERVMQSVQQLNELNQQARLPGGLSL